MFILEINLGDKIMDVFQITINFSRNNLETL